MGEPDKRKLAGAYAAVARALREFGYRDVTPAKIQIAHARWMKGEPPQDILERFAVKEFEDHPDLFGTPTTEEE